MKTERPPVAITGADGFIGRNLSVRLGELGYPVLPVSRATPEGEARAALAESRVVFHLAGVNRPADSADFMRGNHDYSAWVAREIAMAAQYPLVIFASSAKAEREDSDYARSKRAGEQALLELADGATVSIWRLPNVFGKWARPDYNSAVATFCHNLARGLPIRVDDPATPLTLLHIDDLIEQWLTMIASPPAESGYFEAERSYRTSVGEVVAMVRRFAEGRTAGRVEEVGGGLARALYATFISYLPATDFSYPLAVHVDPRGSFTELVKTPSSGQFSVFTAHPGVTRGGHYHHSKVEKFLVVQGAARFRFRNVLTGAAHEVGTSADKPVVVESIPGWTHDVTNIGEDPLVVLVWASENFDPDRPDTVAMPL